MSLDEIRSDNVKCKCEVCSVGCEDCSVKNEESVCLAIAPGSCVGHVLGPQLSNRFAQSTRWPGWRAAHASSLGDNDLYNRN